MFLQTRLGEFFEARRDRLQKAGGGALDPVELRVEALLVDHDEQQAQDDEFDGEVERTS